jgi:trans-aconitate 2-methyltransferase
LAERWPTARVLGLDSSAELIAAAHDHGSDRVRFGLADLREFAATTGPASVDVLVSNAALQWVPGHRALLPDLVSTLTPGGWLAFQVPGNFAEPSHALLHELAADPRFAGHTADVERPAADGPETYLADLSGLDCTVDAWETTYLHVLPGPDPVFAWISGTGARPVLQALPAGLRADFVAEYQERLRDAYPRQAYGTVLPFRRVFVVARRSAR